MASWLPCPLGRRNSLGHTCPRLGLPQWARPEIIDLVEDKQPLLTRAIGGLTRLPAAGVIALVRLYQWLLSPIFGGQCRFHPSCSQYFILAVEKYGFISGCCRGAWRILK